MTPWLQWSPVQFLFSLGNPPPAPLLSLCSCFQCFGDLSNFHFWREGYTTLSALLQNPSSNLMSLTICNNSIDDKGVRYISLAQNGNNMLRELELCSKLFISEIGWQEFFAVLKSLSCRVESNMIYAWATSMIRWLFLSRQALNNNNPPKLLNLKRNSSITIWCWWILFHSFCGVSIVW